MNDCGIEVRLWPDGRVVRWRDRLKVFWEKSESAPTGKIPWLAPSLFDAQVNGYASVDFQSDTLRPDDLERAADAFAADGGGRFLLTLITDDWDRLLARLARLRAWRDQSPVLRRRIAGWHVEGPFLSPEQGYRGAHNPAFLRVPKMADLRQLRAAAGEDLVWLTLAPERTDALACIAEAARLRIRVWLGHTNADAGCLRAALAAGALGFTHLGNGCPPQLQRADNILWRVLDLPTVRCTLIPDGLHVRPPLFRLIHRLVEAERIAYVTDAMSAAGAPPGRYRLGDVETDVGSDGIVRLPGTGNLAGSALRPIIGVFRAAAMLGCGWAEAWAGFSRRPAEWAGLTWPWEYGVNEPDFCLVEEPAPGVTAVTTFVEGRPRRRWRFDRGDEPNAPTTMREEMSEEVGGRG